MGVTQYIGARYIPKFADPIEWSDERTYEALEVVTYQGSSYVSKQAVPAGAPLARNNEWWLLWADFNAQIEAYRNEVYRFDERISRNAADIIAEAETRELADARITTDLTGLINEEKAARISADETINANGWVTTARIADKAITRAKLANEVLDLHASVQKNWPKAYVDNINGNDATAVINNSTKPYKTLDAALSELSKLGNNLDVNFLAPGDYSMSYRFFVGCVLHFRIASGVYGPIHISQNGSAGGVYFYDSHIYFQGREECPLFIDFDGRVFEEEGSTLWIYHTRFTCSQMTLIQGGAFFSNGCVVNGRISAWFANLRFRDIVINNTEAAQALFASCGNIRFESYRDSVTQEDKGGIYISRNPNGSSSAAIEFESSHVSFTGRMLGDSNIGYQRYLLTRGTTSMCGDGYVDTMNSYGTPDDCWFTSYSARVRNNVVLG